MKALNDIKFKETPEEWERMKVVNSRLLELTKELRLKMADVCDSLAKRFLTRCESKTFGNFFFNITYIPT